MEKKFIQRALLKKNLLGQILIEKGLLNEKQLDQALNLQRAQGGFLGDILISLGFINEETLAITFANQFETCYLPLERYKISENLFKVMPRELARRYTIVPVEQIDNVLTICAASPMEKEALGEIELAAGVRIVWVFAEKSRIKKLIDIYYRF